MIVLNNLPAHRASRTEQVATECDTTIVWLSPYSPDFSPVEMIRLKTEAYMRAARARTRAELEQALDGRCTTIFALRMAIAARSLFGRLILSFCPILLIAQAERSKLLYLEWSSIFNLTEYIHPFAHPLTLLRIMP